MSERISSLSTPFFRFLLPPIWLIAVPTPLVSFGHSDLGWSDAFEEFSFVALAFWLLGATFVIWFAGRLRTVWLEDDHLIVKNVRKEELVTLSDVEEVWETWFWNPKMIVVNLAPERWPPRKVVFLAPMELVWPFSVHPVVRRLRALLNSQSE